MTIRNQLSQRFNHRFRTAASNGVGHYGALLFGFRGHRQDARNTKPQDWEVWLGEREGGPADVKMVLRTYSDGGNWTMTEQTPTRKDAKSKKDDGQAGLF